MFGLRTLLRAFDCAVPAVQHSSAMAEFATKLLQRFGFVKTGSPDPSHAEVDFSASVQLSSTGQARVPVEEVIGTPKFQRELAMLEDVANAYRRGGEPTKH